jgi:hypothetical protein
MPTNELDALPEGGAPMTPASADAIAKLEATLMNLAT